jgi:uncharacterized surface protein with fasciclin (FAS1) repeats
MNMKTIILAGTTALAFAFGTAAQAQSSMGQCLSTNIVQFDGTVVDAALATPELSTLVDAVVAAGLVDALNDADNITVYAPTNDAFGAIPGDIADAILGDIDLLTAVLTYHVSPGKTDPRRHVEALRRPTLQGQYVFYHRTGMEPHVNGAAVSCQGVNTSNGFVWIIDSVLLPVF